MRNSLETRLGFFFALALIAAVIIMEMVGGFELFKKGYPLYAKFKNVQELKAGDPVKVAGVQVGRVDSITLTNDMVLVKLKMDQGAQVRTDSKATIKFTGLLGQNFVAIDFGSEKAPPAQPDAMLETTEQADLSQLMVKLESVATGVENLTKSFSGENITELLGPLTDFLKQNSSNLTTTIDNIKTITGNIKDGKGTVGKLINDDELYNTVRNTITNLDTKLTSTTDEVRDVIASAKTTIKNINEGQGTIGKLIKEDKLYTEATDAVTAAKEILQKINRGEGSVGKLINDESLFKNARMTLQKVEKATESLEDQGPLSVLGLAIGSLF